MYIHLVYTKRGSTILREKPVGMERTFHLIASLPEEILHIQRGKDGPQKRKGL